MDIKPQRPVRPTNSKQSSPKPKPQPTERLSVNPKSMGVLERNHATALALSIFLGLFGIDQFYLGKTGKDLLKMFTLGLFGILWVIDIIMIATKSVRGIAWQEEDTSGKRWFVRHKVLVAFIVLFVFGFIMVVTHNNQTPTTASDNSTDDMSASQQASAPKPTLSPTDTKLTAILTNLKQKYPSIQTTYLISKDRDPDTGYGQPGYYNAGAAFCDDPNTTEQPSDAVIAGAASNAYGYACGGVIEVYPSAAGVASRVAYFHSLDGDPQLAQCQTVNKVQVCDFKQVGDVFLHVSDLYQPSQWTDMLNYLTEQAQTQGL